MPGTAPGDAPGWPMRARRGVTGGQVGWRGPGLSPSGPGAGLTPGPARADLWDACEESEGVRVCTCVSKHV